MPVEYENTEENNSRDENPEELPLSEKIVGVITSPVATFEAMSNQKLKASDWLIPIIVFIILSGLASYLYYNNPVLKAEMEEKSIEAIEKSYQEKIDKGEMTQQEADSQKELILSRMRNTDSSNLIFQFIGIAVFSFIVLFFVNGIFFLFIKFGMKGDGNYNTALTAYGLTYYIVILQTIITIILSLAFDKFVAGFSLANFIETEWLSFTGFLLRKADPFLIWFYVVLGIGYAKLFKSENIAKYIFLTLSVWILGSLFLYYLSTVSTIFSGLAM